jgi:hypothetical protein
MIITLALSYLQNVSHICMKISVEFLWDGQEELKHSYFICYLHFEYKKQNIASVSELINLFPFLFLK